jgi:hypothetical protein
MTSILFQSHTSRLVGFWSSRTWTVVVLAVDADGTLWLGTDSGGVRCFRAG